MHLLVLRFSSMGDVALTLPVIRGVLKNNPEVKITIVTRKFFSPFFENIERLQIIPADFSGTHKGFSGLITLFKEIKSQGKFDVVIDLHNVLRTYVLGVFFKVIGINVYRLSKDRKQKELQLKMQSTPKLIHTIERYQKVFEDCKLKTSVYKHSSFETKESSIKNATGFIEANGIKGKKLIGIAPFAKHKLKVWPIKKVRNFIDVASKIEGIHILLFGGGREESEQLRLLSGRYENCSLVDLDLASEIALIKNMRCMISMDSANMHIAALSSIPVISVWGATHPGMGFSAWGQPEKFSVQVSTDELPCRPCSIYGKGFCHRHDFACMERINYDQVLDIVLPLIRD